MVAQEPDRFCTCPNWLVRNYLFRLLNSSSETLAVECGTTWQLLESSGQQARKTFVAHQPKGFLQTGFWEAVVSE